MSKYEYWSEALACAIEGTPLEDVWLALPAEQKQHIAEALTTSAECESMAYAPTPSSHEIASWETDKQVKRLQDELGRAETVSDTLRAQVARDHGYRPEQIYVSDGRVEAMRR